MRCSPISDNDIQCMDLKNGAQMQHLHPPEAGQVLVTEQPLLGSLFKSQNTVWTPSQYEDLKFTMYKMTSTRAVH